MKHILDPSGDLSTKPPTSVFIQAKILGLSAGNKWVTKASGWDDANASTDDVDDVGVKDGSLSGSSRLVISWRRDGPAIIGVTQFNKVKYLRYLLRSPMTEITGISQYGSPGKVSVYAVCTWRTAASTTGSWRSLIIACSTRVADDSLERKTCNNTQATHLHSVKTFCPRSPVGFHSQLITIW